MKVVLDTNIVVASYLVSTGVPARLLSLWRAGEFDVLVSEAILEEYERILGSPRLIRVHGMTAAEIAEDMESFRQYALLVEPEESLRVVQDDPDDDKFFECAVAGGAAYVVSRDEQVLAIREFRGIRVLLPEAFLVVVEGGRSS